jgi:uncharacterized protein with HEPN domain
MSRRFRFYLEDIQASCEKVLRYTQGMNFEDFQIDKRTFDAVVWNLQIIGEAANNISQEVRALPLRLNSVKLLVYETFWLMLIFKSTMRSFGMLCRIKYLF